MNNYKILAAVVFLVLLGFVIERFAIQKESGAPSQGTNFDLSGYLAEDNPGFRPGVWYLLYEKAGSPGLIAELVFDENSSCFIQNQNRPCSTLPFFNGQPVHVEGIENNGKISVNELITIEDLERSIKLFYYDPQKDKDSSGNLLCSKQGLVTVDRFIPITITPIQDSVRLLLQGKLTAEEKSRGVTTEYPLPGLELKGASLKNGILVLEFAGPQNKTGGGACRVGILWAQIEATAKQFPEVKEVKFIPEELFQP